MDLKPITCPKCGGNVTIPEEQKTCYCTWCGAQLSIEDGSTTITYRTVDEARIKELELEIKRMELEEKHRPWRIKTIAILAIVGFAMVAGGYCLGDASGDSDSTWYTIAICGYLPLAAAFFIALLPLVANSCQNNDEQHSTETSRPEPNDQTQILLNKKPPQGKNDR